MGARLLYNGQPVKIQGYACLFNEWIASETGVPDLFRPGCFAECIARGARHATANWNHDDAHKFASTKEWGLRLWEDRLGLAFETTVDAVPMGLSVARYISEGAAAASVRFFRLGSRQTEAGTEITEAAVRDICITHRPAGSTGAWLDIPAPESLTPYNRELRECWLAGREARRAAQIARLQRDYAASQAQVKAARQPRPADDIDWAEPPPGISRQDWEWFHIMEAHARRQMRQYE